MRHGKVTIAIAATDTHALSRAAVLASLAQFEPAEIVVFSDRDDLWSDLSVNVVAPFRTARDYSTFILEMLPNYVATDFVLVIQYDGFVLRGDQFSPHFLHYDYIGAPWPWFDSLNVGNGGFSWRSRRMLDAAARLYERQKGSLNPPVGFAEDTFLCRTNRVALEDDYGVRFAPAALASHFSQEHGERAFPTFGFHGVWRLPGLYRDRLDWLLEHLPMRLTTNADLHARFAQCLLEISPRHFKTFCKVTEMPAALE